MGEEKGEERAVSRNVKMGKSTTAWEWHYQVVYNLKGSTKIIVSYFLSVVIFVVEPAFSNKSKINKLKRNYRIRIPSHPNPSPLRRALVHAGTCAIKIRNDTSSLRD